MVAVLTKNEIASLVVKGHSVGLVNISLPNASSALDAVGSQAGMTRIFVETMDTIHNRRLHTLGLLVEVLLE